MCRAPNPPAPGIDVLQVALVGDWDGAWTMLLLFTGRERIKGKEEPEEGNVTSE